MTTFDGGPLCSGYSCIILLPGGLVWCKTSERYIGKGSKACKKHAISWAGLAKQKEEERKKKELEKGELI